MLDPFATLGVEPTFDLDLATLEKRHRDLSRALHPDRYLGRPATERREALGRAIEVNEAWRVLRDPIRRTEALLVRRGVAVGEESKQRADPMFLMEMMEQREALAEARRARDLERVGGYAAAIRHREERTLARLSGELQAAMDGGDFRAVAESLGQLRFFRRFLDEVAAIEDDLG